MKLQNFFTNITPTELAKVRDKHIEVGKRDKKRLLKKVVEIEKILNDLGFEIELKEI